jgi:hypothetical protein
MGLSQEPYEEEDTDYCFVYDMAKSRGGGIQMVVA